MKTTKIVIKNLFGIKETELDGRSVEISGPKGSGKTSVLDSIRYALTNRSDRDYIVHRGADEGEIIIETDTGLSIDRMRKHLNEYQRMVSMQEEIGKLTAESEELTRKIELARELPATILQTATIPVDGLTVEDGVPLIHGLPISNLSDGELLELCVDITVSKPGQLQIILIDGAERLDTWSLDYV